MSERKVLNKYIPPNFDPSKIPKKEGLKDEQHKVRLMAPFSMRCGTCGDYIYKGRKFNARKETVHGEKYLSIRVYRFYIRCPRCSAEITFKTDPKNADYVAENGATRNFEPWREEKLINEELAREREKEEEFDPMKALENRTMDSKREIDILEGLDEIRTHNARLEKQDADNVRETLSMTAEEINQVNQAKREKDEDDVIISQVFASSSSSAAAAAAIVTKRLLEDEDKDKDNLTLPDNEIKSSQMNWGPKRVKNSKKVGIIKITNSSNASSNPKAKKKQSLVSYSSSDEVD